jgi:peroxiredoxin
VAAIETGSKVPDAIDLSLESTADGPISIADALANGPVLVGLYKSSCQASKTMFPFLERLHQRHAGTPLTVLGVSQDSLNITRSFARRGGITFPILVEGDEYPVSKAFDIMSTPTVYLIKEDGTVAYETMGFFKDPVNGLGDAVAELVGADKAPLYTEQDSDIPAFVPG